MNRLNHFNKEKIHDIFWGYCKAGNLEMIKQLVLSPLTSESISSHIISHCLTLTCETKHLDIIDYLLTSDDLIQKADIDFNNNKAIHAACYTGNLELVEYLLTSSRLKKHANIHYDFCLIDACANGHLNVVSYLLTSPKLKEHANIHAISQSCFTKAVRKGQLAIVNYLLTSPDLIEHATIEDKNNKLLELCCLSKQFHILDYLLRSPALKKHLDLYHEPSIWLSCTKEKYEHLHYLIFDYKVQLTEKIKSYIEDKPEIQKMFDMRAFQDNLAEQLSIKPSTIQNKHKL